MRVSKPRAFSVVHLPAAVDYFGLALAFVRQHLLTLGQPFAVDCQLDSSCFAWTACGVPFGRASVAVAAAAENAVVDSSSVAYCLVHFRQVHSNSDCFAKIFDVKAIDITLDNPHTFVQNERKTMKRV